MSISGHPKADHGSRAVRERQAVRCIVGFGLEEDAAVGIVPADLHEYACLEIEPA